MNLPTEDPPVNGEEHHNRLREEIRRLRTEIEQLRSAVAVPDVPEFLTVEQVSDRLELSEEPRPSGRGF